jgi:hypothetical protein
MPALTAGPPGHGRAASRRRHRRCWSPTTLTIGRVGCKMSLTRRASIRAHLRQSGPHDQVYPGLHRRHQNRRERHHHRVRLRRQQQCDVSPSRPTQRHASKDRLRLRWDDGSRRWRQECMRGLWYSVVGVVVVGWADEGGPTYPRWWASFVGPPYDAKCLELPESIHAPFKTTQGEPRKGQRPCLCSWPPWNRGLCGLAPAAT